MIDSFIGLSNNACVNFPLIYNPFFRWALSSRDFKTIKIIVKEKSKMSGKENGSWNPFRLRKNESEGEDKCRQQELNPQVHFKPETKRPLTFVYSEDISDIVTPVSPHTVKLLEAIGEDEFELVEEELANLTDRHEINRTDRHGFALIHVAVRYNLSKIVNTLLEHGADVNIGTSEHRWTPLHLAARCVCV